MVWRPWSSAFAIRQVENQISGASRSAIRLLDTLANHTFGWLVLFPPKSKALLFNVPVFRQQNLLHCWHYPSKLSTGQQDIQLLTSSRNCWIVAILENLLALPALVLIGVYVRCCYTVMQLCANSF